MAALTLVLGPIMSIFRTVLRPLPPLVALGVPLTPLDLLATLRLCLVMRQLREDGRADHRAKHGEKGIEESRVKDVIATLVVVYGGEAVVCPFLGIPPSFMLSPIGPFLYIVVQTAVEFLPTAFLPTFRLETELPLAFVDAFTRAFLLCSLVPPPVLTHAQSELANSPWTLMLSSLFLANTGFFVVNLLSLLHPAGLALTTPAELRAYGWTTLDLWVAPLATGLWAALTMAQPGWAGVHGVVVKGLVLGASVDAAAAGSGKETEKTGWLAMAGDIFGTPHGSTAHSTTTAAAPAVTPVDPELARAICTAILALLFSARAVRNFGGDALGRFRAGQGRWVVPGEKKGVPRSKIDGKKYTGPKVKAQ